MKKILLIIFIFISTISFAKIYTKGNYPYTMKVEQIEKLQYLAKTGNKSAYTDYANTLITSGELGKLPAGEEVQIAELGNYMEFVKIRFVKNQIEVWTIRNAIENR